jgi:hypothetical protein
MPTFHDRYGYELTASSAAAVDTYTAAIDAALAFNSGIEEGLRRAVEMDPGFAMAHVALARQLQLAGHAKESNAHRQLAAAAARGTTRRERQHVEAMIPALDGDGPGALALMQEHLAEFPRDAYILFQVIGPFGLVAFGGSEDWRRETFALLEPMAPDYGDDWWFLTSHAFAHNEIHNFGEARRLAERSLDLFARQGNGAHTFAHVLFETGDISSGDAFLGGWLPGYEREATIFSHLAWHHALFALECGRAADVLAIYARDLAPGVCTGTPVIAIADAASLMWRCDLRGVERPPVTRSALSEFASSSFPRTGITFADLHCALAHAGAGNGDELDRLIAGLRGRAAAGKEPAGPVVVELAEAIAEFAAGQYGRVVDRLMPLREMVVRVGGSNAQRSVFEDTLLEAAVRAGRADAAAPILKERLERRPSERDRAALAAFGPRTGD